MARKQSMRLRMFVLSALAPVLAIALERTADAASPLDTMFGGKAIVSRNFDVKASAIVNWRQMEDRFRQQQAGCQPVDGCVWRDNLDGNGASIRMRRGGRMDRSLSLAVVLARSD
jgi:hypothetical protein